VLRKILKDSVALEGDMRERGERIKLHAFDIKSLHKAIMNRSDYELDWDVGVLAQGGGFLKDTKWIAGTAEIICRSFTLVELIVIWSHFEGLLSGVQNANTRTVLGDALQRVKELTRMPSSMYHLHNIDEPWVIGKIGLLPNSSACVATVCHSSRDNGNGGTAAQRHAPVLHTGVGGEQ
jgi:hypothetical protein